MGTRDGPVSTFFGRLCRQGVFFVTRLKENALYDVLETRDNPERGNILSDEVIRLSSPKARALCPYALRRDWVHNPFGPPPLEHLNRPIRGTSS